MAHFFFVHLCAVVLHDRDNVNRLEGFLVTLFMEEMSYMLLFTFFFSLPLIFSLVAVSISHFLTATTTVSLLTKKWLLISRSSSPSLNFRFPFSSSLTL